MVGTEEVEFSDTPKIEKLVMKHLQFPLIILAVSLCIATVVCIGEMCLAKKSHLRKVKQGKNKQGNREKRENRETEKKQGKLGNRETGKTGKQGKNCKAAKQGLALTLESINNTLE